MDCPRLSHFVKISSPGPSLDKTFMRCCHMVRPPQFSTYEELTNSEWLIGVRDKFKNGEFPNECIRCKQSEDIGSTSIRMMAINDDSKQTKPDYLIADVMLDNICNGGCQFCNPAISTKLGSLTSPNNYRILDNVDKFNKLPLDQIVQLDITGGEPSNSKNVKELLVNLPVNVKKIRINTNASSFMNELVDVVNKGIDVEITISLDGIGSTFEYIRWPAKWNKFIKVLAQYKQFAQDNTNNVSLNMWTTLNALNVNDFENILSFVKDNNIGHEFSMLSTPVELNAVFQNKFTLMAKEKFTNSNNSKVQSLSSLVASSTDNQETLEQFIIRQDLLRNITIKNYIDI